jgi:hypothetical protein
LLSRVFITAIVLQVTCHILAGHFRPDIQQWLWESTREPAFVIARMPERIAFGMNGPLLNLKKDKEREKSFRTLLHNLRGAPALP